MKFQHGGQRFETKRKQRGRKSNYSWDSFVWTCKISRIQIVVYFKWLIIYQMIQIVVYLQSLLRQVLYSCLHIGSDCQCVNKSTRLVAKAIDCQCVNKSTRLVAKAIANTPQSESFDIWLIIWNTPQSVFERFCMYIAIGSVDPNIPRFYNVHVLVQVRT